MECINYQTRRAKNPTHTQRINVILLQSGDLPGTGRKLEIQEEAGFLGNWKSEESGQSEVRDQGRVRVFGDRRDILCCKRHCRRSGDESSSLVAGVLRVPGSCCIPEPRGDRHSLREVLQHLQVSGLEGRMEGNPGLEVHSCLQVLLIKSPLSVLTLLLVSNRVATNIEENCQTELCHYFSKKYKNRLNSNMKVCTLQGSYISYSCQVSCDR